MNIVFLAREGLASQHIASKLAQRHQVKVLWETGAPARQRKLRRYFKRPFWTWPKAVLDIGSALVYSRIVGAAVDRELGPAPTCSFAAEERCADVNEPHALSVLRKWSPEIVIVYGTALLNRETLSLAPLFLNLHGGMVPKYRNVHCEFWALRESDKEGVGTSVLIVDAGVDSGKVVIQKAVPEGKTKSVHEAIAANVRLAGELGLLSIELCGQQSSSLPQLGSVSRAWPTPGFADLVRALIFKTPHL